MLKTLSKQNGSKSWSNYARLNHLQCTQYSNIEILTAYCCRKEKVRKSLCVFKHFSLSHTHFDKFKSFRKKIVQLKKQEEFAINNEKLRKNMRFYLRNGCSFANRRWFSFLFTSMWSLTQYNRINQNIKLFWWILLFQMLFQFIVIHSSFLRNDKFALRFMKN